MTRLERMQLHRRLPFGRFEDAAFAGLQDSAPRAGLVSLHARMEGVQPDTWEHEELAQVWGPRHAVWLIPRSAVAAFTLGRLPRDPAARAHVERAAERALAGAPDPGRRTGSASGRYLLRWDTRTTTLLPQDPPDVDPEEARLDLARRYLRWFGEELRPRFAAWAGIDKADAQETLRQLPVQPDQPTTRARQAGVRFLPLFDPFLYDVPQSAPASAVRGGLLVDGEVRGWWSRRADDLTIRYDTGVDPKRLRAEVDLLSAALGRRLRVDQASARIEACP